MGDAKRNSNVSPSTPPVVFISYAHEDLDRVVELVELLRIAGADPWFDKERLTLGDDWELKIKEAVATVDTFVACLSPQFDKIGFKQKEVRWAFEALHLRPVGRGFIIPFIIGPCKLPTWCRPFHAGSDLSEPTTFDQLIAAVEEHSGKQLAKGRRYRQRAQRLMIDLTNSSLNARDRAEAASALGRMGSDAADALPALIDMLTHEEVQLRDAAITALEGIGSSAIEAIPNLLHLVNENEGYTRRRALDALVSIDPSLEQVASAFLSVLRREHTNQDDRIHIVSALLKHWTEDQIRQALSDVDPALRWRVVERPLHHARSLSR